MRSFTWNRFLVSKICWSFSYSCLPSCEEYLLPTFCHTLRPLACVDILLRSFLAKKWTKVDKRLQPFLLICSTS